MAKPGSIASVSPRAHWRPHDWSAIGLAVLASLVAFGVAFHFEERNGLDRLRRAADERLRDAQSEFRDELVVLEAVRALWYASHEVERMEFSAFAAQLLRRYPALVGVEWVPRVPEARRDAIEGEARAEGVLDFQIHERSADGRAVPVDLRAVYFPVFFEEPPPAPPARLGFDRGSVPEQAAAFEDALLADGPKTIGPCLWRGTLEQRIFTTALPVYDRPGLRALGDRRAALRGFVVGAFDIDKVLGMALSKPAAVPAVFEVVDRASGLELHRHPLGVPEPSSEPTVSLELDWGGAQWELRCWWLEGGGSRHGLSGLLLGLGLVTTALLALYLRSGQERALALARTNLDLTAAEARSRDAERRLSTLLSNLPGMAYRCLNDPDWSMQFVSNGCWELTGHRPAEFYSGEVTFGGHVVHPEDRGRVWQQVQRKVEGRRSFQLVYRIVTRDGQTRWVWEQGRGVFSEQGELEALEGFITDITAQKTAEQGLRKEKYFSDAAIHSLPGIFYLFDSQGRYLRWNKNLEDVTGYDRSEVAVMHPLEMIVPAERALVESRIQSVFETGFATAEAQILTKDGRHLPYYFTGRRVKLDGRQCLLGMGVDVADRVRAEEERRAIQTKALETQKLESIGLLAGGIAHDFNNLLTAIVGNLKFARDRIPQDGPARQFVDFAAQATKRARDLTLQLLAYTGRATYERAPIDLSEHIREIAHLLSSAISKKVNLLLELGSELPAVEADAAQIQQIAMNLVLNGAEACGDRPGVVRVRTEGRTLEQGTVRDPQGALLPAGRYVSLVVEDTGSGMDEATRERIFDPFFTTKFTGRGLGLSAVLGIVRAHGGALEVRSRPGRGSVFEVLLPASLQKSRRREQAPLQDLSGQGLILAADDEQPVLAVIVQTLTECGYEVLTAHDGRAALELFRRRGEEVDLVLLDMAMPEMSGAEALAAMRRLRPEVPALLCSGYDEKETTRHLLGAGLAGFLQKPFTPEALAAKVKESLASRRSKETRRGAQPPAVGSA